MYHYLSILKKRVYIFLYKEPAKDTERNKNLSIKILYNGKKVPVYFFQALSGGYGSGIKEGFGGNAFCCKKCIEGWLGISFLFYCISFWGYSSHICVGLWGGGIIYRLYLWHVFKKHVTIFGIDLTNLIDIYEKRSTIL
ncbi:MAG: hypothetical protein LUD02_10770, partial [Tannerellaceae bacterium]|nr:hypothetical protein [Tannerellaceae bacterium]